MATIVNTPAAAPAQTESNSSSMLSMIIGVLIVLILAALFFYVALPMMRTAGSAVQAPQVNVPDKINVDVNTPNAPAPN